MFQGGIGPVVAYRHTSHQSKNIGHGIALTILQVGERGGNRTHIITVLQTVPSANIENSPKLGSDTRSGFTGQSCADCTPPAFRRAQWRVLIELRMCRKWQEHPELNRILGIWSPRHNHIYHAPIEMVGLARLELAGLFVRSEVQ